MSVPTDNENWLIDEGHVILERKAAQSEDALRPVERLIRCWWVADYGMRNGGDPDTALDLDPGFLIERQQLASELQLPLTEQAFAAGKKGLEAAYFDRFEAVCDELRQAYGR